MKLMPAAWCYYLVLKVMRWTWVRWEAGCGVLMGRGLQEITCWSPVWSLEESDGEDAPTWTLESSGGTGTRGLDVG